MKSFLRAGLSETPVAFTGPRTTNSEMCAPTVMPDCEPIWVSAMEWPIGAMGPGDEIGQDTYYGHVFVVRDAYGVLVDDLVIDRDDTVWEVQ